MSEKLFFSGERKRFFRPLNSSRRELIADCLRALYDRLHGPSAEINEALTRELLKELLMSVVRDHHERHLDLLDAEEERDDLSSDEAQDPAQLVSLVIRHLLADGWLEQYPDRQGLVTAFRLSRPGKLFSEALWSLNRPSRSRQRNMRGCRNALDAVLSDAGDAHDLVDAYEYAERVIEDLNEAIEYINERIRLMMVESAAHDQWEDFLEFLERFQREYSKQLTVDSATVNRHAICQKVDQLRTQMSDAKFKRIETQLHEVAAWAVKAHSGASVTDWMLSRIDELVVAAHQTKQPGVLRSMNTYFKRVTGLVQQSMMLRTGQDRHAYLRAVTELSGRDAAEQDKLLARIGQHIANAEVRLLDPASFKLRTVSQRQKASVVSVRPRPSREALLDAAMRRAEAEAFQLSHEDLIGRIRRDLRVFQHPVKLSTLPVKTATDVLSAMQIVEAVRSARAPDLKATRLPHRVKNEVYTGYDYEIEFRKPT